MSPANILKLNFMEITAAVETRGTFHDDMSDHIFRFEHKIFFRDEWKDKNLPSLIHFDEPNTSESSYKIPRKN